MPSSKRKSPATAADGGDEDHDHQHRSKRPRLAAEPMLSSSCAAARPPARDIISTLSDELLVRILAFLSETALLDVGPVSRRFCRLAADSQLWRAHYYTRFVLPRAMRIPGFRANSTGGGGSSNSDNAGQSVLRLQRSVLQQRSVSAARRESAAGGESGTTTPVDWRKQYKLRHNWARGKCAVEEVRVRDASASACSSSSGPLTGSGQARTLVKVAEGIAVTADLASGLRAWDLRTRQSVAQTTLSCSSSMSLDDTTHGGVGGAGDSPSSLAISDYRLSQGLLDILVGFEDGSFGVWTLDVERSQLTARYRHEKSSNGELVSVAYGHPYVLTATSAGLISLYTFDHPSSHTNNDGTNTAAGQKQTKSLDTAGDGKQKLPSPILLTSLQSHTTRQPLALSIRRLATSVSASIAYAFENHDGWCIGVQDLLVRPSGPSGADELSSRVAFTLPIKVTGARPGSPLSSQPPPSPPPGEGSPPHRGEDSSPSSSGFTSLCYSHPYLLATLPDNTLILYLCTSTATSLSLSAGFRLWGHTSGISDAEITPRGKAVSISTRGDEIRVWELEGRLGGCSVEVRPRQQQLQAEEEEESEEEEADSATHRNKEDVSLSVGGVEDSGWDDRRNWVGFDDEMVIVLKETSDGRESLMVYDFT